MPTGMSALPAVHGEGKAARQGHGRCGRGDGGGSAVPTWAGRADQLAWVQSTDRNLLFARPPVLDAARMKENCFSLSSIATPSCQTGSRASTGKFCRFSGGFAPSPRAWAGGSDERPGNARKVARFRGKPGRSGRCRTQARLQHQSTMNREGERPREPILLWHVEEIRARGDARSPTLARTRAGQGP